MSGWTVEDEISTYVVIDDSNFSDIAVCYQKHHAVLLSAAPELLQALRHLFVVSGEYLMGNNPAVIEALNAINKAEGKD